MTIQAAFCSPSTHRREFLPSDKLSPSGQLRKHEIRGGGSYKNSLAGEMQEKPSQGQGTTATHPAAVSAAVPGRTAKKRTDGWAASDGYLKLSIHTDKLIYSFSSSFPHFPSIPFFVKEVGVAVHLQQILSNISAAQVTAVSESLKVHLYRLLSSLISNGSLNACVQHNAIQKGVAHQT